MKPQLLMFEIGRRRGQKKSRLLFGNVWDLWLVTERITLFIIIYEGQRGGEAGCCQSPRRSPPETHPPQSQLNSQHFRTVHQIYLPLPPHTSRSLSITFSLPLFPPEAASDSIAFHTPPSYFA
jgi:hypothetical protein